MSSGSLYMDMHHGNVYGGADTSSSNAQSGTADRLSTLGLTANRRAPPPPPLHNVGNTSDWLVPSGGCAAMPAQRLNGSFDYEINEAIPFSPDSPRRGSGNSGDNDNNDNFPTLMTQLDISSPCTLPLDASRGVTAGLELYLAEEMPRGRFILLNLLSTWGDAHEVGINGVEMFNENGERIIPSSECIQKPQESEEMGEKEKEENRRRLVDGYYTASYTAPHNGLYVMVDYPAGTNHENSAATNTNSNNNSTNTMLRGMYTESLFAYSKKEDLRCRVSNIVNGIHNTHDETKLFVMPFTPDSYHLICFVLPKSVTVSMVRVYNYGGCGRVHTSKGVRLLEITMDDVLVFRGEIAPNNGDVVPPHRVGLENCENILFTEEPKILRRLLSTCSTEMPNREKTRGTKRQTVGVVGGGRLHRDIHPPTRRTRGATTVLFGTCAENMEQRVGGEQSVLISTGQPMKKEMAREKDIPLHNMDNRNNHNNNHGNIRSIASSAIKIPTTTTTTRNGYELSMSHTSHSRYPTDVTSVCLLLLGTWGDTEKIGLSGLRFRDAQGDIVSQYISHWYVRFPSQGKGATACHDDIDDDNVKRWADQLVFLFDENTETALTLPCEAGVQIIFVFDTPLPTLGYIEVANYSLGEHTFSGVKEARLFLSSSSNSINPQTLLSAYSSLWSSDRNYTRSTLAEHGIFEITPEEGVSLRKAPAFLSIPRFQVYDLSLAARLSMLVGGSGGSALRSSLTCSLSASMTIRAEMALRRARMAIKQKPEWLIKYQPYITPLLPVAYVLKVSLLLCAKSAANLKKYAKEWIVNPLYACTFADENGETIYTGNHNGRKYMQGYLREYSNSNTSEEKTKYNFVTECLFTALPSALQEDAEAALIAAETEIHNSSLQASVSLVYVSDSPFCVSLLSLNRALVQGDAGCEVWVRQMRVFMDDALVFDSGDVGAPRRVTHACRELSSPPRTASEDSYSPTVGGGSGGGEVYSTRLKPVVFFTLDAALLEKTRRELMEGKG